ncbi:TetR/AcrR family transcriptional regulator [Microbacterium azadirachtae]|uniref:Putative HTH-type transcriptional regulator TtgW n=1 Tax=Microbacterium azadirachtae TaxID=582680 RepID=A0A0F0LGG7_9MICO|nr:TetR/AcrR family transcriptional regulator [Microbacterium azadirachtae]KJL31375.1 putative HTH-type transcriptional regulator TtgW [Microbacterium azadirachtae]
MENETKARGSYRTGRERVERILDAAHELFIAQGYRATSLRDIARAAGVSHPAVLRYFSSRGEILTALIARLDAESAARWERRGEEGAEPVSASAIARAGRAVPGWIELFTALLGEGTSPEHPGHALMLERRRAGIALAVDSYTGLGSTAAQRERELRLLVAGWEGLQILWLYFPGEIDLVGQLARHESDLPGSAAVEPAVAAEVAQEAADYGEVIAAAARQYAAHGYYETSMQAVADDAGITRAALIHTAPTKRALLDAVLSGLFGEPADHAEVLGLTARPRWITAAEVVLICEATVPSHPAHVFFRERLADARTSVEGMLADEGVNDPAIEADWVVGSCLGILIAWLYEPELVDPSSLLQGILSRVRSRMQR